jgi:hypothetical protein
MKSEKMMCIVSGIEKRIAGGTVQKEVNKFGSVEMAKQHFVCREARRLLKARVQPEDVQKQLLPSDAKSFTIDLHALARLKLLKKPKADKKKASTNIAFNLSEPRAFDSIKSYVEEMTGGKDGCQVSYGGTCIRPDIYFDNEFNRAGRCSPCPYVEHCLCSNKNNNLKGAALKNPSPVPEPVS